jgi:hypothetical protein
MKKKQLYLFGILLILVLFIAACAPAPLSGAAGADATEPPVAMEPPQVEPPNSESALSDSVSGSLIVEKFYLPTLTIVLSKGNSNYTTGLSTPPLGTAEYQLTTPKELHFDEELTIKLTVVPDTMKVDKTEVFETFEESVIQAFQGSLDIYPYMVAEIVSGNSFSITPNNKIYQIVTNDKATVWLWYITALQAGEHKLMLDVSVPVMVDQTENKYEMARVEFIVNVLAPLPTNTPALMPPTAEAINNTMTGTGTGSSNIASFIAVYSDLLGAIVAVATIISTGVHFYKKYKRKNKLITDQKVKEESGKKAEEIKANYHKPRNKR